MNQNKIKKIDINNCLIEKQKNLKFFKDYIKKAVELMTKIITEIHISMEER